MNTFADAVLHTADNERVFTENMAITNLTSESAIVDLFFVIGASRTRDITQEFARAYGENPEIAARILLWGRDVRGGAGERATPRKLLSWLEKTDRKILSRLLPKIPEVGRWDDLLVFTDPEIKAQAYALIKQALDDGNGLAAKWMPRKGVQAVELRNAWGLSPKQYRKLLVNLTKVVETQMCAKEWTEIKYPHVPSMAMARYMKAFSRHDGTRFGEYLNKVEKGEEEIKAGAIFPHDIVRTLRNGGLAEKGATLQWDALPDYLGEGVSFLPMCDVSGSMTVSVSGGVSAMDVSLALGVYLSERNKSAFKDVILTFSGRPELIKLNGNLKARLDQLARTDWAMDTNLEAAFKKVLDHAIKNRVKAEDMPQMLIILSDMEFNGCVKEPSKTLYENLRVQYAEAGYDLPQVTFWNLNSRQKNVPVTMHDKNTALVSGFSPAIMKSLLAGTLNPVQIVLSTVMVPRYDF